MRNAVLALALAIPCRATAQAVRGIVNDRDSGRPLADIAVVLVDATNVSRASTVSDQFGRFAMVAPSGGTYRLRLDAVGFFSDTTPAFTLSNVDTVSRLVTFARRARALPPVVVSAKPVCAGTQDAGVAVAALWDEVRNALANADRNRDGERYRFDLLQYERELDPRSHKVRRSRQWERIGMTGQPYESIAADSLAAFGYVRTTADGTWYYAPDARTLLADTFTRTHCLKPVPATAVDPSVVGLAFEAIEQRERPDVRGVLWLDAATSQLRFLDYRYTGLPKELNEFGFGGRVEFERLPNGTWVVDRWQISMPRMARETRSMPSGLPELGPPRLVPVTVDVVAGIIERGGEVKGRERVGPSSLTHHASLEGTIFDSTAGAPLAGAEVWLDTDGAALPVRRASTDAAGRFQMDSVPPGSYALSATHPRLDAFGSFLGPVAVTLSTGRSATVELATPSATSFIRSFCARGLEPDAALMHGIVRRADSSYSVPSARVVARWSARAADSGASVRADTVEVSGTADSTGHYTLCGLPRRTPIALIATDARSRGQRVSVTLDSERIAFMTLLAPIHGAEIRGRITRRNGAAIPYVEVRLLDMDVGVRSDSVGTYHIAAVPAGPHVIEARAVGFSPVARRLASRSGVSLSVDFTLEAVAQVLPTVRRTASRDPYRTGFANRMKQNHGGRFLTNEDIRKRGVTRVTDVLASVPGLQKRMLGTIPVIEFTARGTRTFSPTGCPVAYMVDGVPFEPAMFGLDGDIGIANVEAIEVYDAATTPVEFSRRDNGCGVILIWTRERSVVDTSADSARTAPPSARPAPRP